MKKFTIILISLLIFSSMYRALSPVVEVRYNTYNKSVDCYSENEVLLPEGCAASIKPTVAQTLTGYLVILSSVGLICAGLAKLAKRLK